MLRRDRGFDSAGAWLNLLSEERSLAAAEAAVSRLKAEQEARVREQETRRVRARMWDHAERTADRDASALELDAVHARLDAVCEDRDACAWTVQERSRKVVEWACMAKCCESKDTAHRGKCDASCAKNAILSRVKHDLHAWLLVGLRLRFQPDTWREILEFSLPVVSLGYDRFELRVRLPGDDRDSDGGDSTPWPAKAVCAEASSNFGIMSAFFF